jgi:very-short-patch-repair endonuclease
MQINEVECCCLSLGLKGLEKEYRFHSERRWRVDYAFPDIKLAIEIEGGVWVKGRHISPQGFIKDMEKYNALTEAGWYLLRYQPAQIDYKQILNIYTRLSNATKTS